MCVDREKAKKYLAIAMDDHSTMMLNGYPVRGWYHGAYVIGPTPKSCPEMFSKQGKANWEADHPDHPDNEHRVEPSKCRAQDPANCRYHKSMLFGTSEHEARQRNGILDVKQSSNPVPTGADRDRLLKAYGMGSASARAAANARLTGGVR